MRFQGRKAIVTGANRSMGRAMAVSLAKEGADVVISYRSDEQGAKETVKHIQQAGGQGACFYADFSQTNDVDKFYQQAVGFLGSVDVLINNAAMLAREEIFEVTPELYSKVMQVNVLSPFHLTQLCAKNMIDRKEAGSIIYISSVAGLRAEKRSVAYASSKAAINMLTKNNAKELAKFGVRVNAVAPGVIEAGMNESTVQTNPELWHEYSMRIALGRTGTVQDVAHAALFLASDQAAWITGKVLAVDGGDVF